MALKRVFLLLCIILPLLSACGVSVELPDDPVVFERNSTDRYVYLSVEDRIYVPYCPFERKYLGDCIGYCELQEDGYTGGEKTYIYEFKGWSSDEWIIELDTEGGKEGMILREINAADIPEGLQSEYEWNQ